MGFTIGDKVKYVGENEQFKFKTGTITNVLLFLQFEKTTEKMVQLLVSPEEIKFIDKEGKESGNKFELIEEDSAKRIAELQEQLQKKNNTINELETQLAIKDELFASKQS